MLHLTSRGLLNKAKTALEHGAPRSVAISGTAMTIGLIAGKREDAKITPVAALVGGAGLKLLGFNTIGDGAMAGGASIIGYKMGAKMARKSQQQQLPSVPTSRPAVAVHHAGKRRR